MGLFLDLLHVPVGVTNDTLEGLYKALSDGHDHGDDGIWRKHESPLLARLVELFTQRGLDRIQSVHDQFLLWQGGHLHSAQPSPVPPPPGYMGIWTPSERALAKLYLESLPPAAWTLEDHMICIEYVVQSYLPDDALVAEADWLATKAAMMGKVQANIDAEVLKPKQADALLQALPSAMAQAAPSLSPVMRSVLEFSRARAVENVRALTVGLRHRMRAVVTQHLEQVAMGVPPTGGSSLESKLLDEFGALNRDWRRIAITEAGEAQTQGLIASLKPGSKIRRVEQYKNACAFCRRIDGVVATVVAADHPDKDPDAMVWPGKNNVGRSASPKKRVGDVLVPREPHEMWWLPAGLAHPHCRGRWVPTIEDAPGDDPEFGDVLRSILSS